MADSDDSDQFRTTIRRLDAPPPAASAPRLPVLVVLRGTQVGRRYLLNESALLLGRLPGRADLLIPNDPQVSGIHCRIERFADSWQLVDLASTNGTLVAGQRITTVGLRDRDRIQVGETVLEFTFHDELEDEFHRRVDHLMNVDDLTGLPVQRVFQQRFQEAMVRCQRSSRPLGFFMMDMDGLKKINDTHGHFIGANSIATVGRRLGALIGEAGGTVSRFGGDEFLILLRSAKLSDAHAICDRITAALSRPITLAFGHTRVGASIGVAVAAGDADAEHLVGRADRAMYRAKRIQSLAPAVRVAEAAEP
jgi:diguanylate cyclase (GGDEF)-like protein